MPRSLSANKEVGDFCGRFKGAFLNLRYQIVVSVGEPYTKKVGVVDKRPTHDFQEKFGLNLNTFHQASPKLVGIENAMVTI